MPDTMIHFAKRRLRLKHTWTIARGSSDFRDNVFLTIERNGITGYGEAAPNPRYGESADTALGFLDKAVRVLESVDWRHLVDVNQSIAELEPGNDAAKAAVDIALIDWFCKLHNMPLYRYLGLDRAKSCLTFYSIGIDTHEQIRKKVQAAEDFPMLKVKVGLNTDEEVLDAVRSVTNKPVCVDANEGWRDRQEALEKMKWLETQNVKFIEQPMAADAVDDIRWLQERTSIPLFADESVMKTRDIPALTSGFSGINIKLMKSGGILEAIRMISVARTVGLQVMLGCMVESSLAISAASHLSPLLDYADLDGNMLIANDGFTGVTTQHGKLILPETPGIGVLPTGTQVD